MLYDVKQAAAKLGIRPGTLYDMAQRRKISHRRVGAGRGRVFFTEQDLADYLATCKVERDTLPSDTRFTHGR
jgi:excisionase family DNA binding protein